MVYGGNRMIGTRIAIAAANKKLFESSNDALCISKETKEGKMKSNLLPNYSGKRVDLTPNHVSAFPLTHCNYHAVTLPKFGGGCARRKLSSFRNISGEYFRSEARGEFCCEMIAFATIIITAAIPVLSNVHALADFLRAIGKL
jgi:hypothetical protein